MQVEEPVGYADKYDLEREGHDFWVSRQEGKHTVPLYATQPEQEPIGEVQIEEMGIDRCGVWSYDGNSGMQYPEECDLIGGETDCVEEPPNSTTDVVESESTQSQELSGKTERLKAEIKRLQEREWVGLTDAEIAGAVGSPLDEVYLFDFRKVIAKLKEKNT